ncbi:MAG: metallophosphoesterase family protein [Candidatus Riflebacteria bacterium]|nr:metallophosphoesterase family protein [Candidatus Riflebacteria bacterium]
MKIGLISDTHLDDDEPAGLPAWVVETFRGVDLILHAGDIEVASVLDELALIAPVRAVQGNMDRHTLPNLPLTCTVPLDGGLAVVAHRLADARSLWRPGVILLVHGHTHAGAITDVGGVWVINPGSARRPRDGRPPSVVVAEVVGGLIRAEFKFPHRPADE